MDRNCELLKNWEKDWQKLNKDDKIVEYGKLKMLEEIKMVIESYQESITRQLIVNGCKKDEDVFVDTEIPKNKEYKDPELISVEEIKSRSSI
tara:strand:+ start:667 stop:942 length:276 start_codon:yes stop_codon:yes gene_type:complete